MFGKWIDEIPDKYENNDIVRMRDWLWHVFISLVPVVNIGFWLWWALREKDDEYPASLVNWARAMICMTCIVAVALAVGAFFYFWLMGIVEARN